MQINSKKTKIMPFNFTNKYDYIPSFFINGKKLDVVYESKLIGVIIRSDCKWSSNTKYITSKAKSRLWFIRRLKSLGASVETLLDAFKLFVRSKLEMAVPLWAGALIKKDKDSIERVQVAGVKIILGNNYTDYIKSFEKLNLDTLAVRIDEICLKFAKGCTKNKKVAHWFRKKPL